MMTIMTEWLSCFWSEILLFRIHIQDYKVYFLFSSLQTWFFTDTDDPTYQDKTSKYLYNL